MKTILDHKKDAILNKLIRYTEGIMTRRDYLKLMQVKGARVEEHKKARIDFDRRKFNRMDYQQQSEYEKKCNEQIPDFRLYESGEDRSYLEITKTEYEFFQSLQLSEDIQTENHDLENRIEAGIATQGEIDQDMNEEMEMMNKYYI